MQPVGASGGEGSFENVYYTKDTRNYTNADGTVTQKPTFEGATEVENFASGEVAYKLQSGVKGEIIDWVDDGDYNYTPVYDEAPQIWGQKIGTDKYPTFSDEKVYEDTYNDVNAYRNEINGNKILLLCADKKSATVVLNTAGTYTIAFADYESNQLANLKTFEVTIDKAQAVRVTSDKDFTLGTGDKIMLWDNLKNLTPMCEAYEVK